MDLTRDTYRKQTVLNNFFRVCNYAFIVMQFCCVLDGNVVIKPSKSFTLATFVQRYDDVGCKS